LILDLIHDEVESSLFNISEYEKYFRVADVNVIFDELINTFKENNYDIGDFGVLNLLLYIAVTIERIKEGYYLEASNIGEKTAKCNEYKMAKEICTRLGRQLDIYFPEEELVYVSYLISGLKREEKPPSRDALRNLTDSYYLILTEIVLDRLYSEYGFDFRGDDILVVGLSIHIKMMRERLKKGAHIKNCFVEEIKKRYPIIFEISVFFAKEFSRLSGLSIDEDEIGFIAFHLGAAFERLAQKEKDLKKVAVVCPAGYTASKILLAKIERYYKGQFDILGTYSFMEIGALKKEKPDYIISTVPLELDFPAKVIKISPFFDEKDRGLLEKVLIVDEQRKNQRRIGILIDKFIREDLFFNNLSCKDEKEVIRFLTSRLYEKGCVPEDYMDRVLERERLSPTSFGNLVAIPHSVSMDACETVIAVAILKKNILWGKNKVQLVFMFAIKHEERELLDCFFNQMIVVLDDPIKIDCLIKSGDFKEFKENLMNFCLSNG
jgi:lichenan operon transcriptional antiterminator